MCSAAACHGASLASTVVSTIVSTVVVNQLTRTGYRTCMVSVDIEENNDWKALQYRLLTSDRSVMFCLQNLR